MLIGAPRWRGVGWWAVGLGTALLVAELAAVAWVECNSATIPPWAGSLPILLLPLLPIGLVLIGAGMRPRCSTSLGVLLVVGLYLLVGLSLYQSWYGGGPYAVLQWPTELVRRVWCE